MNNILIPNNRKITHPFRISYESTPTGGGVKAAVYERSFLYSPPTTVGGKISTTSIQDLTKVYSGSISNLSAPLYCILEIKIQSLQVQSAKILWSSTTPGPSIEFGSKMEQKAARIAIGSLVNDSKYDMNSQAAQVSCLYLDQSVNFNLIMANMVFNSVPVIFPVPFCGILP